MKTIKRIFLCGIIGISLTVITSCSDDDNDAIVYQEQEYAGAYSLKDAQTYSAAAANEMFSSEKIDTADFIPFVKLCRYFNDTYLSYKTESGETPFTNIVNDLTTMAGGDLSGLSSILDKFKAIRGSYTADASTKTWKKKNTTTWSNEISLNFTDQYGVKVQAWLWWYSDSTNIIQIKDEQGNVIKDTIPSYLEISIHGGNAKIGYHSAIQCFVNSSRSLEVYTNTRYGCDDDYYLNHPYSIKTHSSIFNNAEESKVTFSKKGNQLISITNTANGENIINSIGDNEKYPLKLDKSFTAINIMDKLLLTKKVNSSLLQERLESIKKAGYKLHSEEFVKAYCSAVAETGETIVSNPEDNIFIFKMSPQPYYDTKNSIWSTMPYYTLNDNSTYSALDFDTTGHVGSSIVKIQELINRLTGFFNDAK